MKFDSLIMAIAPCCAVPCGIGEVAFTVKSLLYFSPSLIGINLTIASHPLSSKIAQYMTSHHGISQL